MLDNTEFYQDVLQNVTNTICGPLGEKRSQVQDAIKNVESEYEGQSSPNQKTTSTGTETAGMGDNLFKKYFDLFKQNMAASE